MNAREALLAIAAIVVLATSSIPGFAGAGEGTASGGGFTLIKGTFSGSGGPSSGGGFTAQTTTAQPDAGEASGGVFTLTGSFAEGDPADCAALTSAIGVTATEASCSVVRVMWDDVTEHETGYWIFRNGQPLALLAANTTIFDDSSAVAGVTYPYFVVTTNACGDADPSNVDAGHRLLEPVSPTDLAIGGVEAASDSVTVNLTWTDRSQDEARQAVLFLAPEPTAVAWVGPDVQSAMVKVPYAGPGYYCFAVAAENCGVQASSDSVCTHLAVAPSGAEDLPPPTVFGLGPVMPNPLNPTTRIAFQVPTQSTVRLRILDVSGRVVRTLVESLLQPGRYTVAWTGVNQSQQRVASGIYFVEMAAPWFRKTTRLVLMK